MFWMVLLNYFSGLALSKGGKRLLVSHMSSDLSSWLVLYYLTKGIIISQMQTALSLTIFGWT